MADYWMKLYIEILDDPKMATLPDRLWRRIIELFLSAKKLNKDGHLPDTKQLAWLLRMDEDALQSDLDNISSTGIIIPVDDGWFIPKFQQRQAAVSDAKRKAQSRNRKQSQQYYEDVTPQSRNVTQRTEYREQNTETETNPTLPPINIFSLYEREIGIITPMISDQLSDAENNFPLEWFEPAFEEAARHNARSWAYCEKILINWRDNGFKTGKSNNGKGSDGHRPNYLLPDGV